MPTEERANALENEYFHRQEKVLIEKMRAKLESEQTVQTEMNCPRCDGKLAETEYESIKIDVCGKCNGVWLDAGELTRILNKEEESQGWFSRVFG